MKFTQHLNLPFLTLVLVGTCLTPGNAASTSIPDQFTVPVLVIHYFPTNGPNIDLNKTGDWGESLAATREKTRRQTREVIQALEEGSRYRGYLGTNAIPCLKYQVAGSLEFLSPLPTVPKAGHDVGMTDYRRILELANIKEWVEGKGVKEVWIWGYHGGKVDLWESNMASPFGDISNSDRDANDLPVLSSRPTQCIITITSGAHPKRWKITCTRSRRS